MAIPLDRSVTTMSAFGEAFRFMRPRLFSPFNLSMWLMLGFLAFLGGTLEIGVFTYNFQGLEKEQPELAARGQDLQPYTEFFFRYFWFIVTAILLVFLGLLVLRIVWIYVACRGRFLFLEALLFRDFRMKESWARNDRQAGSLFWWKLCTGTIGFLFFLAVAVSMAFFLFNRGALSRMTGSLVVLAAGLFTIGLCATALSILLEDFVVPLMWSRRIGVLRAWGALFGLVSGRPGLFALYVPLRVLFSIAAYALTATALCLTCCLAALPVIGQTFLLPLYALARLWPVMILAGLDPATAERVRPLLPPPPARVPWPPPAPAVPFVPAVPPEETGQTPAVPPVAEESPDPAGTAPATPPAGGGQEESWR